MWWDVHGKRRAEYSNAPVRIRGAPPPERGAAERRSRFLLKGILTGMCGEVIGEDELDAVQACRVPTGR